MIPSFFLNVKCLKEHLFKTPRVTDFQYNSSFNKHEQLIKGYAYTLIIHYLKIRNRLIFIYVILVAGTGLEPVTFGL